MEGKQVGGGCSECTAENVAAFNARLRSELPEAYALARAFHSAGLMDGLRGARIGPVGSLGQGGVVPELSGAVNGQLQRGNGVRR